ncbi:TOMM precursor leader peptide-binding protein [Coleofasciculus sp.]|uniref:TOMM precursor leader peptide-binding protein n=1 Tax=Coleofasciculus sp. TaxID=3100458 RepID=UPI0039F86180
MIEKPKIKSHLYAEAVGEKRVLLIAEGRYFALSGRAYAQVIPLIDGFRTTDEIVDTLESKLSATEVYRTLLLLEKYGHIEESVATLPSSIAAYWNTLGVTTHAASEALDAKRVCLFPFGNVPKQAFLAQLEAMHVSIALQDDADLWVALVDDYLQGGLAQLNRRALETDKPWLIVRPSGVYAWIGPLFFPGQTGCWACLSQRLHNNFEVDRYACQMMHRDRPYPALAALPATVSIGLGIAAAEVAKWIVLGEAASLKSKVLTFDSISLQTKEHLLVRRPQCPECGEPAKWKGNLPVPLRLQSVVKQFVSDGGHRAVTPEQTLSKYEHHISPITGIAKSLTRVSNPDDDTVHVYVSGNNMAARYDSFTRLRRHVRSACCGKGISDAQAQVSALCEAIERYSGVFRGEEIRQIGTAQALGDRAIDPRDCMLFSPQQYRDRDRWNALDRRLDTIPLPFDPTVEMEWTPLWSMTRQEFRYLPTSYCFYSYPSPPEQFYCLPDSNGCAAGNTPEEAILQGFMELAERDSVAMWWYNRLRRPTVNLDSFDDPFIQELRVYYRQIDRDLWVLDLTNDLGIPAFIAISNYLGGDTEDIIFAPAAHFDPRMGVVRALTELNQMLPGVVSSKGRGTGYEYDDPEAIHWWQTATLKNQPYLLPAPNTPARQRNEYLTVHHDDIREDVMHCQSIVEGLGLEMLVLDQTRPDVGLPVVKVVVPGLRHFWARYAPGRLYDIPVKLGWRTAPLSEEELNPISIFI